jgi:hypothetical protein
VEFNPFLPGVYCAGNAGDGGVVSTNGGRVVLGPNAGNAHWLNASEIVCQHYTATQSPHLVAVGFMSGGAWRELLPGGVNKIVAGFGHWFAASIPNGPMLDGQPVPSMNVRAFGPNGQIAWFPWNRTGLIYRDAAGVDHQLSTALGPEDPVKMIGDGIVWAEAWQFRAWNLPGFPAQPVFIPGGMGCANALLIAGVWWLIYHSYPLAAVVMHPATELRGYQWPAWNAYRLDATLVGNTEPHLGWSTLDSDDPAHIQIEIVDLSRPRVALTQIPGTPVPVPDPPKPEPKPMKTIPMPARVAVVVQALYERNVPLSEGDDDQRRALMTLIGEQLAYDLGPSYGCKDGGGGRPRSKDAIGYLAPDGTVYAADCFNGATRKPAVPDHFEESAGQHFESMQPIDHLGAGKGTAPEPDPTAHGGDFVRAAEGLQNLVDSLVSMVATLAEKIRDQDAVIAALEGRKPAAVTGLVDGAVVALKSHDNGEYLTVEPGGDVNASDPSRSFGDWQLFRVEIHQ